MGVSPQQRFTSESRCPICGGYAKDERGKGRRCYGFRSSDRQLAHCTREEKAGPLPMELEANTYAHFLIGECRCGARHDTQPSDSRPGASRNGSRIVAEYDYKDASGQMLFQVVRLMPKDFKQRRPGKDGWVWSLGDVRRVLYRLPELLVADPDSTVYIPEGEKDVDNIREAGSVATCNPEGAGKWRNGYSEHLRGRYVCVLPDNDDEGRKHAMQVARSVQGIATAVKVLEVPGLPKKGDASDWLKAGGTMQGLEELAKAAPEWTPQQESMSNGTDGDSDVTALPTPVLVDLGQVEAREVEWLWDGRIPRGFVSMMTGDPDAGKTFVLLSIVAAVAGGGHLPDGSEATPGRVLYLDGENGSQEIKRRLGALDFTSWEMVRLLSEVEVDGRMEPFCLDRHVPAFKQAIVDFAPDLIVVDPLVSFHSRNEIIATEIRKLLMTLATPAQDHNAAVVFIQHKAYGAPELYRVRGSLDFVAASRAVLMVTESENGDRALVVKKLNLARKPKPIGFRLVESGNSAKVEWLGEVNLPKKETKKQQAMRLLEEVLVDGPVPTTVVMEWAEAEGIGETTLKEAKKDLRVKAVKMDADGPWRWCLCTQGCGTPKDCPLRYKIEPTTDPFASEDTGGQDDGGVESLAEGASASAPEAQGSLGSEGGGVDHQQTQTQGVVPDP